MQTLISNNYKKSPSSLWRKVKSLTVNIQNFSVQVIACDEQVIISQCKHRRLLIIVLQKKIRIAFAAYSVCWPAGISLTGSDQKSLRHTPSAMRSLIISLLRQRLHCGCENIFFTMCWGQAIKPQLWHRYLMMREPEVKNIPCFTACCPASQK